MRQVIDIIDKIPSSVGAYGFVIRLKHPLLLEIGKFDRVTLQPGLYFYGGSAYGPGGLKARLGRHIRPKTKLHWHIDHVTCQSKFIALGTLENGNECDLVSAAEATNGATIPVPGFGSSDCANCRSHLIKLKRVSDIAQIFKLAGITKRWRF